MAASARKRIRSVLRDHPRPASRKSAKPAPTFSEETSTAASSVDDLDLPNEETTTDTVAEVKHKALPVSLSSAYEIKLMTREQADVIIGVDEAGRGCLAGPVVACACFVPIEAMQRLQGVVDSKLLDEPSRELVYRGLETCEGLQFITAQIDGTNILSATLDAMTDAVLQLLTRLEQQVPSARCRVVIDGNRVPERLKAVQRLNSSWTVQTEAVISGDAKVFSVAAASILAKVTRDRLITSLAQTYPHYGFDQHKGYGTQAHLAVLKQQGPCSIHRLTFKPICLWLLAGTIEWPKDRDMIEVDPVKRQAQAKKQKASKNQLTLLTMFKST